MDSSLFPVVQPASSILWSSTSIFATSPTSTTSNTRTFESTTSFSNSPNPTTSNTFTSTTSNTLTSMTPNTPTSTTSNTPTSTSVPTSGSSNSATIDRTPIIGGVVGGLVLISLLLALFFFTCRRNNRRSLAQAPNIVNLNPFTVPYSNPNSTFLPHDYTSNGQSPPSQYVSSKFTQSLRDQPSDPSLASTSRSDGIPPLTSLQPQFLSPAFKFISPSSPLRHTGRQTNFDRTTTRVPHAATEPSVRRSPPPRGRNARILRHEDSGVRIPHAEDDVVELPPFYSPD